MTPLRPHTTQHKGARRHRRDVPADDTRSGRGDRERSRRFSLASRVCRRVATWCVEPGPGSLPLRAATLRRLGLSIVVVSSTGRRSGELLCQSLKLSVGVVAPPPFGPALYLAPRILHEPVQSVGLLEDRRARPRAAPSSRADGADRHRVRQLVDPTRDLHTSRPAGGRASGESRMLPETRLERASGSLHCGRVRTGPESGAADPSGSGRPDPSGAGSS